MTLLLVSKSLFFHFWDQQKCHSSNTAHWIQKNPRVIKFYFGFKVQKMRIFGDGHCGCHKKRVSSDRLKKISSSGFKTLKPKIRLNYLWVFHDFMASFWVMALLLVSKAKKYFWDQQKCHNSKTARVSISSPFVKKSYIGFKVLNPKD